MLAVGKPLKRGCEINCVLKHGNYEKARTAVNKYATQTADPSCITVLKMILVEVCTKCRTLLKEALSVSKYCRTKILIKNTLKVFVTGTGFKVFLIEFRERVLLVTGYLYYYLKYYLRIILRLWKRRCGIKIFEFTYSSGI